MVLIFCLRIRMPRLSEGLILHVRQHEIVWKYLIWTYSQSEEAELWQSRQSRSAFTSLGMKADLKCETADLLQSWQKRSVECGGGTRHIWQWRQSVSGEADLQIFGNQDWAKVQTRNCKSLEVQAEMKCGSGTSHLWKSWQNKCGKRNLRSLPVKTERKCGGRTSYIWQSRQSESAEAELHIFGSQCRTKVRTWNFRSLAVKAERKWGSGTLGFWQLRQSRSVEVEFQIFSRQDRAEVQSSTLTIQSSWTCGSRS